MRERGLLLLLLLLLMMMTKMLLLPKQSAISLRMSTCAPQPDAGGGGGGWAVVVEGDRDKKVRAFQQVAANVTRHTPHVTRYASHVTRHTSQAIKSPAGKPPHRYHSRMLTNAWSQTAFQHLHISSSTSTGLHPNGALWRGSRIVQCAR